MKLYGGVDVKHLLDLALDGAEWQAARFVHFISTERCPGSHWMEAVQKRKIFLPS
jgi:hypothetical protein